MKATLNMKNITIVLGPLFAYYGFLYGVYILSTKGITNATPQDIRMALLASLLLAVVLICSEERTWLCLISLAGLLTPFVIGGVMYLGMSFIEFSFNAIEIQDIDSYIISSGLLGILLPVIVSVSRRVF